MNDRRVAGPAIKGYAYQFDRTIIAILDAEREGKSVTIEGCEDIDIHGELSSESVQCKYHEDRAFSLSGLRQVILPMLQAFRDGKRYGYRLYAHYSDAKSVPRKLTVTQIKQALTEKKRDSPIAIEHFKSFSTEVLCEFAEVFSITPGPSYDRQQEELLSKLAKRFRNSAQDAKDLHYGNALSLVIEIAIRKSGLDREVTPSAFLEKVDKRVPLFSRWQDELIGRERVIHAVFKKLKSTQALRTTKWRALAISGNSFTGDELAEIALFLAADQYGERFLWNARPWTLIIDGSPRDVELTKKALVDADLSFNDGYEHLAFNPRLFSKAPVINRHSKKHEYLGAHSYEIRILGAETFTKFAAEIEPFNTLISVGDLYFMDYSQIKAQRFHLHSAEVVDIKQLIVEGHCR